MDQEKKQKVMLGVVALAIIGAGGFWWLNSGSGGRGGLDENTGPVVRVERDTSGDIDRVPVRAERTDVRREADTTVERAERREAAQPTVRRATRGREDTRREREKEVVPAS